MNWNPEQMPPQDGSIVLITGANSGIGLEAAKALAARGARIVMACRSRDKGERALAELARHAPAARCDLIELDLAELASVRGAAEAVERLVPRLDILINNAGVMALPRRQTADGFEMQLGTNHLGHFALTARLLPLVERAEQGRVVTISSVAHKRGRIHWRDLQLEHGYGRWTAYAQSKLANVLFAFELGRRLAAAGSPVRSVACHPGYAATNLQNVGSDVPGQRLLQLVVKLANAVLAQSAEKGAWPTLRAATDPSLENGAYVGPTGFGDMRGPVDHAHAARRARDEAAAERLWNVSEELTGERFELGDHRASRAGRM